MDRAFQLLSCAAEAPLEIREAVIEAPQMIESFARGLRCAGSRGPFVGAVEGQANVQPLELSALGKAFHRDQDFDVAPFQFRHQQLAVRGAGKHGDRTDAGEVRG
ncbi:MAG: hypothetical protein OXH09_18375 [Gammaproteobacteria bacterium]|nr:hypothetical protein [Gammaproteobacteria bacterium]